MLSTQDPEYWIGFSKIFWKHCKPDKVFQIAKYSKFLHFFITIWTFKDPLGRERVSGANHFYEKCFKLINKFLKWNLKYQHHLPRKNSWKSQFSDQYFWANRCHQIGPIISPVLVYSSVCLFVHWLIGSFVRPLVTSFSQSWFISFF